jgi:hypothetical protein
MAATRAKYTTQTGQQVIEWLVTQPWFADQSTPIVAKKSMPTGTEQPPPIVVLERRWQRGNRCEIACLVKSKDGGMTVTAIFFFQDGVMKFHDLFLRRLRGDRHDIFLSYVMDDPGWARANFDGYKDRSVAPGAPGQTIGGTIQGAAGTVVPPRP